jgi:hypothetical protein
MSLVVQGLDELLDVHNVRYCDTAMVTECHCYLSSNKGQMEY